MKKLLVSVVVMLCTTALTLKANDICTNAIPINCDQTLAGSTAGATFDDVGFCGTSNTSPGVWYTYTSSSDITVSVSTCNQANFDTKISVFSGTCPSLSCVDGNDDLPGTCSAFSSYLEFSAQTGTTYYILVHGYQSNFGDFDLTLTCIEAPVNDQPCAATALALGDTTDFSGLGATADDGEVTPGPGSGSSSCEAQDGWCGFETDIQNSIWYTFVAPASGCVSISTWYADYQLAVYSVTDCGDYSTYTKVAANDDSGPSFAPLLDPLSCLTPGATYYIQLDGYNGETSSSSIVVTDCGGLPLACDAGGCQTRLTGYAPVDTANHLAVSVTGGYAPYLFEWSGPGIITDPYQQSVSVDAAVTTTYTVVVTDASGCSTTCDVTVNVYDISCGKNGDKVMLCHAPSGNPDNREMICVSPNALKGHLNSHPGDKLGPCDNDCWDSNPPPPPCYDWEMIFTTDQYGGDVGIVITDLTDNFVMGSIAPGSLNSNTTYILSFGRCLIASHCYEVEIIDTWGDGVCCTWGNGNYYYVFNGDTTWSPSGGDYGSGETTTFGNCAAPKRALQTTAVNEGATITAYPNPFTTFTTIEFVSDYDGKAQLKVFDINGKLVDQLFEGNVNAGDIIKQTFNSRNNADGIYIYTLEINDKVYHGKVILNK